jgi:hypothetical protein
MIDAAGRVMTTAESENLEQADRISPDEHAEEDVSEDDEDEDWLDNLDLKLMPLKWAYQAKVKFYYAGRMEPLPFDFGNFFDDEERSEE